MKFFKTLKDEMFEEYLEKKTKKEICEYYKNQMWKLTIVAIVGMFLIVAEVSCILNLVSDVGKNLKEDQIDLSDALCMESGLGRFVEIHDVDTGKYIDCTGGTYAVKYEEED